MGCGTIFAICTRFNILLLSSVAIGGSFFTTFSCHFFTYQALDGVVWEGLEGPFQDLPEASVGLFSYSEDLPTTTTTFGKTCQRFNDWKVAGQSEVFQVAQVASIVAPLVAFLAWVQIMVEFMCCRLYGGFVLMSTMFLLAAAAQACTFLVFADTQFCYEPASVNECQFELGAYYSFGAMLLYTILACLVSNIPPSPGQRGDGYMIYTGWKSTPDKSSHSREISPPAQADPEMAPPMESKETEKADDALSQQPEQHPKPAIEDEEMGNEEIIEEEVLVIEDENGVQTVVEEEIVEEGEVVMVEEGGQPLTDDIVPSTNGTSNPEAEAPNA